MKEKIMRIILECLQEIKEENDLQIQIKEDAQLLGGEMDSMDFVNFVVDLEGKLLDELDMDVAILSEKAFSKKTSPFSNVKNLYDYIVEDI